MKLIAHRGGSFGRENSLDTMLAAARMGADAVECDIRRTKDGELVIYHDSNLSRLTGQNIEVSDLTCRQMQDILWQHGQQLLTFDQLARGYHVCTPILLHIKLETYDEAFARMIVNSGLPLIVGVVSLEMLKCFSPLLPRQNILAFLPSPKDADVFYHGGAGILRLWEQWLGDVTPAALKARYPDAEVFIMACSMAAKAGDEIPLQSMDGSVESLDYAMCLGADGMLLNNIEMALAWRTQQALHQCH